MLAPQKWDDGKRRHGDISARNAGSESGATVGRSKRAVDVRHRLVAGRPETQVFCGSA